MRALPIVIAAAATLAFAAIPTGTAAAPAPQHVKDVILLGNPAATPTRAVWVNTGVDFINGIDAYVIHLQPGLTQFRVHGNEDPVGGCDIDAYFYTAQRTAVPWAADADCLEEGTIPTGAATVVLHLSVGVSVGFTFDAWHPDRPPA